MSPQLVDIFFQIVVFLFAISVHESAHAWVAWRRGDPTAYMLGRVTLNPIKHIDPIGTILLPIIAAFTSLPLIGWARPTPVNPRNFKKLIFDDILTTAFFLLLICSLKVATLLEWLCALILDRLMPSLSLQSSCQFASFSTGPYS